MIIIDSIGTINMKLKFSKLQYQQDAIDNIIKVLDNSQVIPANSGYSNPTIMFNKSNLYSIIADIQKEQGIDKVSQFEYNSEDGLNLDIMMETGTGKTITFIETMYRLNQEYDISKFIIIVPSSAIRSGTIKNISITKDYFKEYGKNIAIFDGNVDSFIKSSNTTINVLITTFQAFNKSTNVIHKNYIEQSLFNNATSYIKAVQQLNPVIIIDEPHRLDGDKTKKSLKQFMAPLTLRFGATFNNYKNLIYSLDSAKAFRTNLVKSITVNAIGTDLNISLEYLGNRKVSYCVGLDKQIKKINDKDNLADVFNDEGLNGYIVDGLGTSANPKCIKFDNGFELYPKVKNLCDSLSKKITEAMITEAINSHFNKERQLFDYNIKALSLFFIDKVDSYYQHNNKDGELAKFFEKAYKVKIQEVLSDPSLSSAYRQYLNKAMEDIKSVHNGYFAKSNSDKDNQDAVDLILKDKEKLLSFEKPLRFIFSKWALREGWDNPNIFTIIKLSPSNSSISKLQQIGRGLRLAVDIEGNRITAEHPRFEEINDLEVIIPKVEKDFVQSIQDEINTNSLTSKVLAFTKEDLVLNKVCLDTFEATKLIFNLIDSKIIISDKEFNCKVICTLESLNQHRNQLDAKVYDFIVKTFEGSNKVKAKRVKQVKATINKIKFNEFKELWAYINSKATAKYDLNTNLLIRSITNQINTHLDIQQVTFTSVSTINAQDKNQSEIRYKSISNIKPVIDSMTLRAFIQQLILKTKLTQSTIIKILSKLDHDKFISINHNYRQAIQDISRICNDEIYKVMVNTINFSIIETNIINTSLTDSRGLPLDVINAYTLGRELLPLKDIPNEKIKSSSLYLDYMAYDSDIERGIINSSNIDSIQVFAKIPKINIPTPIGNYNPDFAYVLQANNKAKQIFLVIETKGYSDESDIHQSELDKISVGRKFFEAIQEKFPNITIKYKTYLNNANLVGIIGEALNNKD